MLILTSCQYSPYADEYTTEEPLMSAVIGSYVLDKQTISPDLKTIKDSMTGEEVIPRIEFFEDSTYKVEYLPNKLNTVNKEFITK
ncbi:hypothetical protein ADICEAN_02089 [Cesiribacter andamanensis AMV16]|uniref:Uncharacterized protein n=1 Tax=Cesiribacter andamanensis AMV16 TaxID=1279009 RepID=M7N6B5_9BACT|nr:hypothetical protein ADICEAN_02089 [Cesiribacter andamanensis AMV16]